MLRHFPGGFVRFLPFLQGDGATICAILLQIANLYNRSLSTSPNTLLQNWALLGAVVSRTQRFAAHVSHHADRLCLPPGLIDLDLSAGQVQAFDLDRSFCGQSTPIQHPNESNTTENQCGTR